MSKSSQFRKKRSIAVTAAVLMIVAVLLFIGCNWLATALETRYALSSDLSFNALTLQSAVTKDALKALAQPIDLYLLTTATADMFGDSVLLRSDLRTILERYRSLSPMIDLQEESLLRTPIWAKRFSEQLNTETITQDCVVIYCEDTNRARMLTAEDFLRRQYDLDSGSLVVTGYAIEKALTEAIVYVSSPETPTVQILTGHGELDASETQVLEEHLADAGYQPIWVSLHDEAGLDKEQPLLVMCPRFDLTETELDWLRNYLNAGGGLMYMASYNCPVDLPRFNKLLGEFGLSVCPGIVVATGTDQTSYYNESTVTLLPYMQAVPETYELLSNSQDILLMPGSRAVEISEERDTDIYAESLLKSGEAYLRTFEDGTESLDRQEGDVTGYFNLAALARRYDDEKARGTVIVIGSASMFTEAWIYENTYQDAFLRMLFRALGTKTPASLDISTKSAVRSGLCLGSLSWAVWVSALLPLLVLILALVILLPRRHL